MNRRFNKDWFWEETFDSAADLPALLAALDAAMAHRRRGTRPAHLTPLNDTDLYHLGDDDLFPCGSFRDEPHKPLMLVDTAGGALPAPAPNLPRLRAPFGTYKGWTVINRRQSTDLLLSEECGSPWYVRNHTMFYIFRGTDGSFSYDRCGLPKHPVYWQILDFARPDFLGTTWALAVNVEMPLTDPADIFTRPCRGFVTDGTAKTLTLTDNYDALAMFRDTAAQYLAAVTARKTNY